MSTGLAQIAANLIGDERVKQVKQINEIEFWLWEENWQAYEYFNQVGNQWVYAGMGELTSLNGQFVYQWIKDDMPKKIKKVKKIYRDVMIIADGFILTRRKQQDEQ